MSILNDNKQFTSEASLEGLADLKRQEAREIRLNFDAALTSSKAQLWITIAYLKDHVSLAKEMESDLLFELGLLTGDLQPGEK